MKILFWNTNRNSNINQYIASIVKDNNIDILVTAEYRANKEELFELFHDKNICLVECNTLGNKRIDVWSGMVDIEPGLQDDHYSLHIIKNEFILCCVHFMSDLHGDYSEERREIAERIILDIQKLENKINSKKSIIIGDFNEMPYGRSCLSANGFHGLPVLRIDDRVTRVVNKKEYRKFYNPMWNLFGDFTYPPGTYYLNQSKMYAPMWYMLDQVIMSQEVVPLFERKSLRIITSCTFGKLMDDNEHPNRKISDHFPIMCEIK